MLVPLHHDLGKKDKSNIINNNKDRRLRLWQLRVWHLL